MTPESSPSSSPSPHRRRPFSFEEASPHNCLTPSISSTSSTPPTSASSASLPSFDPLPTPTRPAYEAYNALPPENKERLHEVSDYANSLGVDFPVEFFELSHLIPINDFYFVMMLWIEKCKAAARESQLAKTRSRSIRPRVVVPWWRVLEKATTGLKEFLQKPAKLQSLGLQ